MPAMRSGVALLLVVAMSAPAVGVPAQDPLAPASTELEADVALREAARAGDAAGVAAAAARGGHPDQTVKLGASLLQRAVEAGDGGVAAALLAAGATVDLRSSLGETPLHAAVGRGDGELVRLLLAAGADPNARMKYGRTPLLLAAEADRSEIACRLLEAGARVNEGAKYEVTPLHAAAGRGALATARLLLEAGADPLARDRDGDTPYDLALRSDRAELVALLAPRTPEAARRAVVDPDAPVAALGAVDFRNRKYRLEGGLFVRVRDGVAAAGAPEGPEVLATTVLLGTLGEPERERAAILLRWSKGGRGPFTTLLLYGLDRAGRPIELARLPTGEGALGGVRGLRFADGLLIVTQEWGAAACCADRLEETRYRWREGALVALGETVSKPLD